MGIETNHATIVHLADPKALRVGLREVATALCEREGGLFPAGPVSRAGDRLTREWGLVSCVDCLTEMAREDDH